MRLTHLYIEKFRDLEEITLPMDQLRVLIGQNGAGKSSILEAIRILGDDNIELTENFSGARIYELKAFLAFLEACLLSALTH